jgi:hypothetical protein
MMVLNAVAQKPNPSAQRERCGTMIHLEALLNQNSQLKAINDGNQKQGIKMKEEYLSVLPRPVNRKGSI